MGIEDIEGPPIEMEGHKDSTWKVLLIAFGLIVSSVLAGIGLCFLGSNCVC